MRCVILVILLACKLPNSVLGQGIPPIGHWREHLPFNNAVAVGVQDGFIYSATPYGFFSFEEGSRVFERKTKINGLTEVRVAGMITDPRGDGLLLWYENSNIDLVKGDRVVNIPDILLSNVAGDKRIFHALWQGKLVYLSTGLGIIVLDIDKNEVRDTYRPSSNGDNIRVNAMAYSGGFLYAATAEGLKHAPAIGANLSDFRTWQLIQGNGLLAGNCDDVGSSEGRVFIRKKDTIQIFSNGNWNSGYRSRWGVLSTDTGAGKIIVGEKLGSRGRVVILKPDGQMQDSLLTPSISLPRQVAETGTVLWIADQNNGLLRIESKKEERVFPNSPISTASGEMTFTRSGLWVAAGAVNGAWNYTFNPNGLFQWNDENWNGTNLYVYPQIDSLLDYIPVAEEPATGKIFAGSFGGGLLEVGEGKPVRVYKQGSGLQQAQGDPGSYRVSGLAFDPEGNLWISNYGALQNLVMRKPDGNWLRFSIPFLHTDNAVAQILVDDQQYKWIMSPKGNGLFCFDDRGTPEQLTDDRWRYFRQGRGNGNLPSAEVLCLAKDRDGFIWIGTTQGIAIVQCMDEIFTNNACEAVLPVVQQDNFAGFLFRDEEVRTIAVDGANRKWVGTKNGVWLISADGQKIISRFSEDNSPLLSNLVHRIAVDPVTGEVFISTFNGICSFRGTATDAAVSSGNVLVFPNPVPPSFSGTIAIRGLPDKAWVKITEADGRLVYQTRAVGGQAVWDGRNYTGSRVSSGAYLVLVADGSNQEKLATKIFFIR